MDEMRGYIDHPGSYIREELEERGWSQRDLAYILGRREESVNLIISGKRRISVDMAKALEEAFDVPAEFFINLQNVYDLSRTKEPDPGIKIRAQFYQSSYPIREMIKRGWLEDTHPSLLEIQMARFFEVDNVMEIPHLSHAAKKTNYKKMPPNQVAWLFRVKQIATSINVPRYSENKLQKALSNLEKLTSDPEETRHIPRILMECGIRYIIVETLPMTKIDGVCFWLDNYSPVIGMTVRHDRIDNFWFVLMHEIKHILEKHGKKYEIIDTELEGDLASPDGPVSLEEKIANLGATEFCVPRVAMDSFYKRKYPYISEQDIIGFAQKMQRHPGIVVGQLHNKTKDYRYFRKYLVKIREHLFPSALIDGWGQIAPVSL
jgi:HTH-type transcriptional regulator/antitoxin HigA